MLELVREVCDANNAFDLAEEKFLVDLTHALELSPDAIADLVVHAQEGIHGLASAASIWPFRRPSWRAGGRCWRCSRWA